jgi:hypothetical protein
MVQEMLKKKFCKHLLTRKEESDFKPGYIEVRCMECNLLLKYIGSTNIEKYQNKRKKRG